MHGYGQFCPVAKTMEVLDERWTVLVIREMLSGSHHFNELRRGVPRMSPALLSKRLRSLTRLGIVMRMDEGGRTRYELTPAGHELGPVVMALGDWGTRWMMQLGDEDLDPHLLMWDIRRNVDREVLPHGRTVIAFDLTDVQGGRTLWWLVGDSDGIDLCDVDPGHPATVRVITSLRTLTRVWRGDISWSAAQRDHGLSIEGPTAARRAVPTWFNLSPFSEVDRPALTSF